MVGSPIKQSLSFCLLILLLSAVFALSQGRPFNSLKRNHGGGIQSILDGFQGRAPAMEIHLSIIIQSEESRTPVVRPLAKDTSLSLAHTINSVKQLL
ncbi:hypothetical protein ACSBR1_025572 [Camellia fascicularis]